MGVMAEPQIIGNKEQLSPCWSCKGPVARASLFCETCGAIQPPGAADHFQRLGLARDFALDGDELSRRYLALQSRLHPDRFASKTARERAASLAQATALNDAYRTLRDPVSRVEYLLRLEGVRKDGEVKQQAPADLLEEVFELNEYLEELRAAKSAGGDARALDDLRHRLEKTRAAFQEKLDAVLAELTAQFPAWDEKADRAALARLSEILNRHNYIRNLVRNVTDELES